MERRTRAGLALTLLLLTLVTGACGSGSSNGGMTTPTPVGSTSAWSDEFDGPANASPDPGKWTYDLGNGGWGNQELETYTSSRDNVRLDGDGHLVIHVLSTPTGYTSARLKTQGLFGAQYGHLEARIKLPGGQGIWPAFWMLGENITTVNWPQCGEIDIMENIGSQPGINRGSMHGPGYSGGNSVSAPFALSGTQKFSDAFHTFAIDWAPGSVRFAVDNVPYETVTRVSIPSTAPWVFDARFFIILNVAVGGTYPGPPNPTTQFPQDMLVDYIRYTPLPAAHGS